MNRSPLAASRLVTPFVVLALCLVAGGAVCRAQTAAPGDEQGAQVLTRGPVHEAFAGVVSFNPVPGVVVPKAPPDPIEEVPPDERPEGANVTWIPGYWAWDDERSDFLWVSGVWRALPPGRQWVAGYWGKTAQGFQWTSGYWADATAQQTTYLPSPPATVEVGPNIEAPGPDYGWVPGCWVWYQGRFAWQPGYWVAGRADWEWSPAYYVWTPRGCVFVGGYWDYPVERRGVLFAPVYFDAGVYGPHGYYYSPTVVINLAVFPDHLFLRPAYCHYYFGDYYAATYVSSGFYASYSFSSRHYGYDPIYAHERWEHRQDHEWEHRVAANYQYRRDHEDARPPRTWVAEKGISASAKSKDASLGVATSFDQVSKAKAGPLRFQPVAKEEKQQLAQRQREVTQSRTQRQTVEASAGTAPAAKPGVKAEPFVAKLPQSPIVAQSAAQLGKAQAPPAPHKTPAPDVKVVPRTPAPVPEPKVTKDSRQPESVKPEPQAKPVVVKPEVQGQPAVVKPEPQAKPVIEQPVKREPKPETQLAPVTREAKPDVEKPVRHEAPPEVAQPAKREPKPEPDRPAKDKPRVEPDRPAREKPPAEGDKGATRDEKQPRDGEQQGQPNR